MSSKNEKFKNDLEEIEAFERALDSLKRDTGNDIRKKYYMNEMKVVFEEYKKTHYDNGGDSNLEEIYTF